MKKSGAGKNYSTGKPSKMEESSRHEAGESKATERREQRTEKASHKINPNRKF